MVNPKGSILPSLKKRTLKKKMHRTEEPELKEEWDSVLARHEKLLLPQLRLLPVAHVSFGAQSSHRCWSSWLS